jgi:hypothetical protein
LKYWIWRKRFAAAALLRYTRDNFRPVVCEYTAYPLPDLRIMFMLTPFHYAYIHPRRFGFQIRLRFPS